MTLKLYVPNFLYSENNVDILYDWDYFKRKKIDLNEKGKKSQYLLITLCIFDNKTYIYTILLK